MRATQFPGRRAVARSTPLALTALVAGAVLTGCGGNPEMETRTFDVQHLTTFQTESMVWPYVYGDRPGAPGELSVFEGGLTVRETPDNLERIARVLEERDRARPGVTLYFQLIEADGPGEADPRIEDVEAVLRELFRFEGYRLLSEARIGAMEGGVGIQGFRTPDGGEYQLMADVRSIRGTAERGSVEIEVRLHGSPEMYLETRITVPVGQTVVLGSSQMDPAGGATILTVRPELVP
jgi:hypothetical protein